MRGVKVNTRNRSRKMGILYTIMIILLVGALYFGAMAHVAKFAWFDVKRTTQFSLIAIVFTILFIILALVLL